MERICAAWKEIGTQRKSSGMFFITAPTLAATKCSTKCCESTVSRAPRVLHCLTVLYVFLSFPILSARTVEECVVPDFSHFSCSKVKTMPQVPLFLRKLPHTHSSTLSKLHDVLDAAGIQPPPVILVLSYAELNSLL